jgi:sulfite reductase (ferredoxin)
MEGLAIFARRYGDGSLRTAVYQKNLLPNVMAESRDALGHDLAALGLSFEADSLVRNSVACTGKQFCSFAVIETKGLGSNLKMQIFWECP